MKKVVSILGMLIVVGLVGGCGRPAAAPQPAVATPTDTPVAETVTLTVWDQFQRDTERAVMDELNAEFETSHTGVKVNRVVMSFDDLKATVGSALQDDMGPDVVQINQGADMRAAVQAGLLLSLAPYLPAYRWEDRFPTSILARNSFTDGGERFGTGNLFGVSPTAEVVGVYYNKAKFEGLGFTVPRTFAAFEALLTAAKHAGEVPIVLGNRDQMAGIHVFSAIEHVLLGNRIWLDRFVYEQGGVSFDIPANVQAAAKVQEWVRAGFFSSESAEIGYEDSWKQFAAGDGLMMLAGSWLSPDIVRTGGERFGFFLLPPLQQAGRALSIGGVGVPFSIRRGTHKADLAAEYLDWMVSLHAGELWLENGVLPAVPVHASKIPAGTLLGDIVLAYDTISVNDGVGQYIDWAGPTLYGVLGSSVQDLMSMATTPQGFVAAVQAELEKRP